MAYVLRPALTGGGEVPGAEHAARHGGTALYQQKGHRPQVSVLVSGGTQSRWPELAPSSDGTK